MSVARSKRLAGPVLLTTTADVSVYTCPTGRTALLKSIRAVTGAQVGAGTGALILGGIDGTSSEQLVLRWSLPYLSSQIDSDTDPIVLNAGESLVMRHSGASGLSETTITISGAELVA